jgi:hypothetical protein
VYANVVLIYDSDFFNVDRRILVVIEYSPIISIMTARHSRASHQAAKPDGQFTKVRKTPSWLSDL